MTRSKPSPYPTLKDHDALKAKVEFDNGRYEDAMRDLDAAITEDYESAQQVFNDGNTKPSTTTVSSAGSTICCRRTATLLCAP